MGRQNMIPHKWRPRQIWRRFLYRFFIKCTTYTPRYLPKNCWVDKDAILEHMCFEILSKFIEKESTCSFVDWYYNDPCNKTESGKFIIDELKELYDWWHHRYIPGKTKLLDRLWEKLDWRKVKLEHKELYNYIKYVDEKLHRELETNLVKLVKIRRYMWT